ncbi:zinc-dependent peptidase [Flavobacterium sp. CBA20B-1]|uniref:zinc-dependent peptidase n=1 Tax=unclassified Flavobacterium TaxID=196869 RepID=UPI0022249F5F|nr:MULTISPECIES: zinc-dependent peptidase [unclassified Flavobacterium]WCM43048.1 zinc-dependent peptidase [Flavobacterium sp. CBA20B-1]
MLFFGSSHFYDRYRLENPNGNFSLKLAPEQVVFQFADAITKVFPIFNQLPHKFKLNFSMRILEFLKQYAIIPKENAQLTIAHKVAIAATYVKLTLGYKYFLINTFNKIIVYPTAYYFPQLDETHTGHFNPKLKTIMLALDVFENDILYNEDGKDVALHEFTHALCFEMLQTAAKHPNAERFKKGFRLIVEWIQVAENQLRIKQVDFVRAYAFTDRLELVSVLIELFFEKETAFKQHFPDLYLLVGNMIKHPKTK